MRTLGATDKRPRKPRSDRGKKRKTYAGKPVKKKVRHRYDRRIGNKQHITIRPLWRVPMSKDGYKNWKPHLRYRIHKEVTNMKLSPSLRVNVKDIDTKAKMEDFIARNKWEGKFVVMGLSHGKTKTHVKWVNICTIMVKETPEGNIGKMIQNRRLSRYKWFYKG